MLKSLYIRLGYVLCGLAALIAAGIAALIAIIAVVYIATGNLWSPMVGFDGARIFVLGFIGVFSGLIGVFLLGQNGKIRNW